MHNSHQLTATGTSRFRFSLFRLLVQRRRFSLDSCCSSVHYFAFVSTMSDL